MSWQEMLLGCSELVCTYLFTQILTWGIALLTPKNFARPTGQVQNEFQGLLSNKFGFLIKVHYEGYGFKKGPLLALELLNFTVEFGLIFGRFLKHAFK